MDDDYAAALQQEAEAQAEMQQQIQAAMQAEAQAEALQVAQQQAQLEHIVEESAAQERERRMGQSVDQPVDSPSFEPEEPTPEPEPPPPSTLATPGPVAVRDPAPGGAVPGPPPVEPVQVSEQPLEALRQDDAVRSETESATSAAAARDDSAADTTRVSTAQDEIRDDDRAFEARQDDARTTDESVAQARDELGRQAQSRPSGDGVEQQDEVRVVQEQQDEVRVVQEQQDEVRVVQEQQDEVRVVQEQQDEVRVVQEQQDQVRAVQEQQDQVRAVQEQQHDSRAAEQQQDEVRVVHELQEETRATQAEQAEARAAQEHQEAVRADQLPVDDQGLVHPAALQATALSGAASEVTPPIAADPSQYPMVNADWLALNQRTIPQNDSLESLLSAIQKEPIDEAGTTIFDRPGEVPPITSAVDAALRAQEAGWVNGFDGVKVDAAIYEYRDHVAISDALNVSRDGYQAAHLIPSSVLRSSEDPDVQRILGGQTRRDGLVIPLRTETHTAMDRGWKSQFVADRRSGETSTTADHLVDTLNRSVQAVPTSPVPSASHDDSGGPDRDAEQQDSRQDARDAAAEAARIAPGTLTQRMKDVIEVMTQQELEERLDLRGDSELTLPYRNVRPT